MSTSTADRSSQNTKTRFIGQGCHIKQSRIKQDVSQRTAILSSASFLTEEFAIYGAEKHKGSGQECLNRHIHC